MRKVKGLVAVFGATLAIQLAACSATELETVADTSQQPETQDSSRPSDSSTHSQEKVLEEPVDVAEFNVFKNRLGNAPRRADGFYDYMAPGFKLLDICAELEQMESPKVRMIEGRHRTNLKTVVSCFVSSLENKNLNNAYLIDSIAYSLSLDSMQRRIVGRGRTDSGFEIKFLTESLAYSTCTGAIETPGGVLSLTANSRELPGLEEACVTAGDVLDLVLAELLLNESN